MPPRGLWVCYGEPVRNLLAVAMFLVACSHAPAELAPVEPSREAAPEVSPAPEPAPDSTEIDVEPIGSGSAVVAAPQREPIGSFKLCGAGCASLDPRWTEGGKTLPDDE